MPYAERSRRTKIISVRPEEIMTLMGNWQHHDMIGLPVMSECADESGRQVILPPDYRIGACTYDWESDSILMRIHHDSFPEIEEAMIQPRMYLRMVTVTGLRTRHRETDTDGPIVVEGAS